MIRRERCIEREKDTFIDNKLENREFLVLGMRARKENARRA
jgi:hypothetical protein